MLKHAIAHEGCTDTVRESALKVDWEKNPLLHRGIEPASAACRSDALPTVLHPAPFCVCVMWGWYSCQYRVTDANSTIINLNVSTNSTVSRCGLAVRRLAGKQKDLGSIRVGTPFSFLQKLWFMDTVL